MPVSLPRRRIRSHSTFPARPEICSSSSCSGRDLRSSSPRARGSDRPTRKSPAPRSSPIRGFDFQWGTLALGPTNPPGLDKLKDVPNYTFTLNQPFEIAKRGPRQAASRSARDAALFDAVEVLRQRWFDLLERISEIATAEIRVGALEATVRDAQRLADLQPERQKRGDIAGLDVDRAVLEAACWTFCRSASPRFPGSR